MSMGSPLHVMRMSSSLNTLMVSFMKTGTVPLSDVLPMLIRDVGKSWNVLLALIVQIVCERGVGRQILPCLCHHWQPHPVV
jgi:hypothetical protein